MITITLVGWAPDPVMTWMHSHWQSRPWQHSNLGFARLLHSHSRMAARLSGDKINIACRHQQLEGWLQVYELWLWVFRWMWFILGILEFSNMASGSRYENSSNHDCHNKSGPKLMLQAGDASSHLGHTRSNIFYIIHLLHDNMLLIFIIALLRSFM